MADYTAEALGRTLIQTDLPLAADEAYLHALYSSGFLSTWITLPAWAAHCCQACAATSSELPARRHRAAGQRQARQKCRRYQRRLRLFGVCVCADG